MTINELEPMVRPSATPRGAAPRYSMIMPVYNAAHFFRGVLDSIPDNRDGDWELIIVDDCSTDGTVELIRRHPKAVGIRLLKTERNSGPAVARNLGAREASGDYLLFFDADILFLPDTFERVKSYIARNPEVQCFTGINSKESAAPGLVSRFHSLYSFYALDLIPENGEASTWNPRVGFIRKDLFRSLGGFDTRYRKADIEDYALSKNIARVTPIRFTRSFEIRHRFGGLKESTASFFKRSRQWVRLWWRTRSFDRTGHTRLSNLPNLAVSVLLGLSLLLWPIYSAGEAVVILSLTHAALNARVGLFFARNTGVLSAPFYLFLILYFQWVAMAGVALGAVELLATLPRGDAAKSHTARIGGLRA